MSPLWNILGTTLGVVSSRLGEDYVNACTESVEEVIVEHYNKQINFFKSQKINNELKRKIEKFCKEEDDHREDAINSKSKKDSFGLRVFKRFTKLGTKAAIEISKEGLTRVLVLNPSKESHSNFYVKSWVEKAYQFLLTHNYLEYKAVYLILSLFC